MKFFGVVLGLMMFPIWGLACDNCNVFLSINPNDYSHNFGVQLRTRSHFGSFNQFGVVQLKHGGADHGTFINQQVQEYYSRIELTGTYFLNQKWNLQVVVPMVQNQQIVDDFAKYNVTGLGDPILIQNYQVFNTKDEVDSVNVTQRLTVGVGIKLPLGRFNRSYVNGTPNLDLQTGTGSLDGIVNTTYVLKYKKIGSLLNLNYKLNTSNADLYRYGNTLNGLFDVFYQQQWGQMVWMPTVGVYLEDAANDYFESVKVLNTQTQTWFYDFGLSLFVKRIKFQANYQQLFASFIEDEQQLTPKWRMSLGLNYYF